MPRHALVTLVDRLDVRELRVTPEGLVRLGVIEEAVYLAEESPGFFARLLGGEPVPQLTPPFDRDGNDLHGLVAGEHRSIDDDDTLGEIRLARGRVQCLSPRSPGDEVVVRDVWLPQIRVVTAVHFGLSIRNGPPVAVAFAQSPLVIAPGGVRPFGESLRDLPDALAGHVAGLGRVAPETPADVAELRAGDEVDVLGVVAEPREDGVDLRGYLGSYRDAPSELTRVLGDVPGVRMVLRRVGEAAAAPREAPRRRAG